MKKNKIIKNNIGVMIYTFSEKQIKELSFLLCRTDPKHPIKIEVITIRFIGNTGLLVVEFIEHGNLRQIGIPR